ncbi:MAG TPA: CPBP family intramembrane glutamic endopeptidase [Anaerolineae bacterium]|nr:CPBP family intramembrane glutamic endopeptidase [Anaerolineae bacterium]
MSEETPATSPSKPYNWRLLLILVAAILISVILLTPYALTLQAETLKEVELPVPLNILLPFQWLQTTLQYGFLAALGLLIAGRLGLGLPFLESLLARKPDWQLVRKFIGWAILAGVLVGVAILLLDLVVFAPAVTAEMEQLGQAVPETSAVAPPAWQGFLASFYGGVTEEILLRLFALSLFAWLGRFLNRTVDNRPGRAALWAANILAAVLFGLSHLPATAAAGLPLTGLVITRAIVLNGLAGLVFGRFYWTYGLEAAMVSHFATDMVLHVITPLLAGR